MEVPVAEQESQSKTLKAGEESKGKTSTGLPIGQSFTAPTGTSSRPATAIRPLRNVFKDLFKDDSALPVSATINKPQSEVFATLRDIRNFPMFFDNLEKVVSVNERQSKWYFRGETDEAEEANVVPMQLESGMSGDLAVWKAEDAAGFSYSLAVHLEPAQAGRGTIVRIKTSHDSATGNIVGKVEKLMGKDPKTNAKKILQRFKAFCETGHVPTTEGQPSGRDKDSTIIHPDKQSTTLKH